MKNMSLFNSEETKIDGYERICRIDELKEFEGRRFFVNDTEIAVFKKNGEVYALNNICPHQHSALIYDGFLEEGCVVCPAHGWKFDLKTGKRPGGSRGIDSYDVKVSGKNVFVKIDKKEFNW